MDNGAGLTREEIIRYLATAGAGYTRKLRQVEGETTGDDSPWGEVAPIGQFGLGFLSAFFVSDRVEDPPLPSAPEPVNSSRTAQQ